MVSMKQQARWQRVGKIPEVWHNILNKKLGSPGFGFQNTRLGKNKLLDFIHHLGFFFMKPLVVMVTSLRVVL